MREHRHFKEDDSFRANIRKQFGVRTAFWSGFQKMITPPKSKTPWTAMTTGATNKNTQLEKWGPVIDSAMQYIPYVGQIASVIGGEMGMKGRNTGFQGTDKGIMGNVMPMIQGATPEKPVSAIMSTGGSYIDNGHSMVGGYNTDPQGTTSSGGADWLSSISSMMPQMGNQSSSPSPIQDVSYYNQNQGFTTTDTANAQYESNLDWYTEMQKITENEKLQKLQDQKDQMNWLNQINNMQSYPSGIQTPIAMGM